MFSPLPFCWLVTGTFLCSSKESSWALIRIFNRVFSVHDHRFGRLDLRAQQDGDAKVKMSRLAFKEMAGSRENRPGTRRLSAVTKAWTPWPRLNLTK
jgi:hypothetical protein